MSLQTLAGEGRVYKCLFNHKFEEAMSERVSLPTLPSYLDARERFDLWPLTPFSAARPWPPDRSWSLRTTRWVTRWPEPARPTWGRTAAAPTLCPEPARPASPTCCCAWSRPYTGVGRGSCCQHLQNQLPLDYSCAINQFEIEIRFSQSNRKILVYFPSCTLLAKFTFVFQMHFFPSLDIVPDYQKNIFSKLGCWMKIVL